jgi:hypothetical protein
MPGSWLYSERLPVRTRGVEEMACRCLATGGGQEGAWRADPSGHETCRLHVC